MRHKATNEREERCSPSHDEVSAREIDMRTALANYYHYNCVKVSETVCQLN